MSEEKVNQELSANELKDVAGAGPGPMGATGKVPYQDGKKKEIDSVAILGQANGVTNKKIKEGDSLTMA